MVLVLSAVKLVLCALLLPSAILGSRTRKQAPKGSALLEAGEGLLPQNMLSIPLASTPLAVPPATAVHGLIPSQLQSSRRDMEFDMYGYAGDDHARQRERWGWSPRSPEELYDRRQRQTGARTLPEFNFDRDFPDYREPRSALAPMPRAGRMERRREERRRDYRGAQQSDRVPWNDPPEHALIDAPHVEDFAMKSLTGWGLGRQKRRRERMSRAPALPPWSGDRGPPYLREARRQDGFYDSRSSLERSRRPRDAPRYASGDFSPRYPSYYEDRALPSRAAGRTPYPRETRPEYSMGDARPDSPEFSYRSPGWQQQGWQQQGWQQQSRLSQDFDFVDYN